ncbi:MAG: response regulator [Anaerolineales bacterium]|nr:MAG: response regulator [Anaerolineales bacterium]
MKHIQERRMEKAKIIIVEDESITAYDLQVRLENMGYTVPAIASSGDQAIRAVAAHQPDLLLMDINIRGERDGITVAQEIRERFDIPIIYLTAFADTATIERASYTEPFGYLIKPFQEQELYSNVEMALYKHKSEQRLRENERRLQISTERLHALHTIEQSILGADSPRDISQTALQSIGTLVACRHALVMNIDDQKQTAEILASYAMNLTQMKTISLFIDDANFTHVMQSGEISVVSAPELFTTLPGLEHVLCFDETLHYTNVPLRSQGELIGVLTLGSTPSQTYDESQMDIICELANSLALAIHHSRLHQELLTYTGELAQRNEDLDAFAHTVAHDLKVPIGVITGYCGLLMEEKDSVSTDDLDKYLSIIARTTDKMKDIVNALLLLAEVRKKDVCMDKLNMSDIVQKAQYRLRFNLAEKAVDVFSPSYWPSALGYAPWIEEVWVNFLDNAMKYGGNPPKIWLGTDKVEDSMTGEVQHRFWIKDNGDGIPTNDQAKLFTPFTRMDRVFVHGHGLGLSIVRSIMDKLGGAVGVVSSGAVGQGCLFYFTLPADNNLDQPEAAD